MRGREVLAASRGRPMHWHGTPIAELLSARRGEVARALVDAGVADRAEADALVAALLDELRRPARARRAGEELDPRLRDVVEHAPAAVYVKDRLGHYVFANRWFTDFFDLEPAAVLGRTAADLFPPSIAARVAAREREARAAGELVTEDAYPTPRGERVLMTVRFPFRLRAGESGLFVIGFDVTDRKRAQAEAELARERLRAALERLTAHVSTTPLAVVEWDSEYRVTTFSRRAEELFGWSAAEILGKRIDEMPWIPPEDWPSVRAVMRDMSSGERPTNVNANRNLRKDGSVVFCEWYNSALCDAQGRLVSVLSLVLDATARKQAEDALRAANARLREADRRKDEFLGMLSHELRNPLAPIRSSIYILNRGHPSPEEAARARAVIERQTEHLSRLVDDLLDVTRIARGKIELRRERADVAAVVRRAAEDHGAVALARRVDVVVEAPPGPLWAVVDATRVAQIVGNLVGNAVKFTPSGGTVTVSVEAAGTDCEIRVRDTGVGIPPEIVPLVFDAFVQGEHSLARTDGGLGLGLALVKGLAELHGGSVAAASAGEGKGAVFTVRLPRGAEAHPADPPGATDEPRPGAGARKVLVVEDSHDAAETMADLLRLFGHAPAVAKDGPTAVRMAREDPPDVILCDIGLPGMDGYEVARILRADPALRGIRLVAVSGYAQPEDLRRAREAGFDLHLSKPPDPEEIRRAVTG